MRRALAVLAAALLLLASGCGGEDLRQAREQAEADLQARVDDLRERARQAGDDFT